MVKDHGHIITNIFFGCCVPMVKKLANMSVTCIPHFSTMFNYYLEKTFISYNWSKEQSQLHWPSIPQQTGRTSGSATSKWCKFIPYKGFNVFILGKIFKKWQAIFGDKFYWCWGVSIICWEVIGRNATCTKFGKHCYVLYDVL